MIFIRFVVKHLHDLLDMLRSQYIIIGLFFEQPAGVDKLGSGIALVFGKHQNVHGDGGAVKQVGREGNHGFYIVVIHQILADFLFRSTTVKNAGEADDSSAPFAGKITQGMEHKGKVGLGFRSKHTGRSKAFIVNQRRIVTADPLYRVRRIGNDSIKGLVISKMGFDQGIAQLDVELVVVDVMQKHVHPRQVVRGVIDLLAKETVFNDMGIEVLFGLQQQGAGTGSGVIDFINAGLLVHSELGDQLGNMLRGEKLTTGFAGIGSIV